MDECLWLKRIWQKRILCLGTSLSLNVPILPSKPCQITSSLVCKSYAATGQACGALPIMVVLQAYLADLLKYLFQGEGLSPKAVTELHIATDLALCTTKQTARSIGLSMAAMVVT